MTTRFCTSCRCMREEISGTFRKTKAGGRWICGPCLNRTSESVYKNRSGRPADVKEIMAKLYRNARIVRAREED